jgi:NitT/TauT family transport system substrate-binding protein
VPITVSFSAYAMSNVPLAIGQEAGYFREEGLDVNVLAILASAQNAAALITGEVDLSALGGIGPMRARLGGTDLVLIGATKPYFAGAIVARPDIAAPADLRGKRVGISAKGGNTDLMARSILPRVGLEPDRDVVLVASGSNPETVAALSAGAIDAAAVTPPGDESARNLGFPTLVDVTALRLPYPAVALGTAGRTLANRSAVLERALRAYGRAVHRFRTDRDFTLSMALGFLRSDDLAANEQAYEVERAVMQPDLDLPLAAIQSALDLMQEDEPRAAGAHPEDFVDLRLLQGLQRSGFFDSLGATR